MDYIIADGSSGQLVHPRFVHTGDGPIPSWGGHGLVPDPTQTTPIPQPRADGSHRLSICRTPKRNATVCKPEHRTMNVDAPCGSPTDATFYAPWRYPGAAPVIDSCGVAGGTYQWQGPAAAGGDYSPTANAIRGDLGYFSLTWACSWPFFRWFFGSVLQPPSTRHVLRFTVSVYGPVFDFRFLIRWCAGFGSSGPSCP